MTAERAHDAEVVEALREALGRIYLGRPTVHELLSNVTGACLSALDALPTAARERLARRLCPEMFDTCEAMEAAMRVSQEAFRCMKASWTAQCHSPSSCMRHLECMYLGCPNRGLVTRQQIEATIAWMYSNAAAEPSDAR